MKIELNQVYRCKNNNIVRTKMKLLEEDPKFWMFDVEILYPELDKSGYSVTGEGHFWENAEQRGDEPDDIVEHLSKEKYPEYYL